MLLHSNILIYAARPEHGDLRRFIATRQITVSAISKVEVLGFHRLTEQDKQFFNAVFACVEVLPLSTDVIDEAVILRQPRKIPLEMP